jgi:hypothetical protein
MEIGGQRRVRASPPCRTTAASDATRRRLRAPPNAGRPAEPHSILETLEDEGNDDAIVWYNTGVRIIHNNPSFEPRNDDEDFQHLE